MPVVVDSGFDFADRGVHQLDRASAMTAFVRGCLVERGPCFAQASEGCAHVRLIGEELTGDETCQKKQNREYGGDE